MWIWGGFQGTGQVQLLLSAFRAGFRAGRVVVGRIGALFFLLLFVQQRLVDVRRVGLEVGQPMEKAPPPDQGVHQVAVACEEGQGTAV